MEKLKQEEVKYIDQDLSQRQTFAGYFSWALIFNGLFFSFVTKYIYGSWSSAFIYFSASLTAIIVVLFKKRIDNHIVFSNIILFLAFFVFFGMAYLAGGTHSVSVWLFGMLPLIASALMGIRSAIIWTVICFLAVTIIRILDHLKVNDAPLHSGQFENIDFYLNQMGLIFIMSTLGIIAEKVREKYLRKKEEIEERAFFNKNLISLGEMCSGIAHEINNPMTVIIGNTEFLKRSLAKQDRCTEKELKSINKIENMVTRVSKIIESLRILARDGASTDLGIFPIRLALDEAMMLIGERFSGKEIKFLIESDETLLATPVQGIQVQLAMVLINLIENAVDASEGSKDRWIKIEIEKSSENLLIRVIDNGEGVPDNVADQIFTPFFTTKEVGKGTGLGLSYCNQILKRMNGGIKLKKDHPFTCFEISLNLI